VQHRHLTTSGIPTTVAEIHSLLERGRTADMRAVLRAIKDDPFSERAENAVRAACDGEVYGYPAMIRIGVVAWRRERRPLMSESQADGADWYDLFTAAADFQGVIPGAVPFGGTAAKVHVYHRFSTGADHVIGDLRQRFDALLAELNQRPNWRGARVRRRVMIMGAFEGVETTLRQLPIVNNSIAKATRSFAFTSIPSPLAVPLLMRMIQRA